MGETCDADRMKSECEAIRSVVAALRDDSQAALAGRRSVHQKTD